VMRWRHGDRVARACLLRAVMLKAARIRRLLDVSASIASRTWEPWHGLFATVAGIAGANGSSTQPEAVRSALAAGFPVYSFVVSCPPQILDKTMA